MENAESHMQGALSAEELVELLRSHKFKAAREGMLILPAADIAELISEVGADCYTAAFRLLPKELAAEVFVEMEGERRERIISSFSDGELSEMLSELYYDDTVDLIEEMPATVVKRIIRNSTSADRAAINRLLRYGADTAGGIMTTEYVRLRAEMTVAEALSHVRRVARESATVYTCYVTDSKRKLLGTVGAGELLISPLESRIGDIMSARPVLAYTNDDREGVARKFDKYGLVALPVVDKEGRLVGIVTVDDAISVLREETEEDFAKMAAITPSDTGYLGTGAFSLWRARVPWLFILMISATFSSAILSGFEEALPAVLLLFVPMLMDTGGNSGAQASVTVIRALSVGEIRLSDIGRVLRKEFFVGILAGLALGAAAAVKVVLIDGFLLSNPAVTPFVGITVGLTVTFSILTAKLIGSSLPLLARRLGFDPAVMASPFITTLVDTVALLLYFGIARLILV